MTVLKDTEDLAQQINEETRLSGLQSKVAAGLYRGQTIEEIAEDLETKPGNIRSAKQRIKAKIDIAERTLEAVNEGYEDAEETRENTFLSPRMMELLEADQNRTYISDNLQERLEENPDLEINTIDDIVEELDLEKNRISVIKSNLKNVVEKAENTLDVAEKVL